MQARNLDMSEEIGLGIILVVTGYITMQLKQKYRN